ncbi:MAG: type II toxin-antitoxin system VapC family toxin [Sphingomonadales bacterium]|nr:type II toxin-antitoxin system VapC family toxin [Sphingomonadales bacterium]
MIVLDTNVLSELMRPAPAPEVERWLGACGDDRLVTTVITVSEIEYGLARLPDGRRRKDLEDRFGALTGPGFDFTVLPLEEQSARLSGRLRQLREAQGQPASAADMMIAAICKLQDAALATRNVRDFQGIGLALIDPWSAGA